MTHFAEIDPITKIVLRVIVIEQEMVDTGKWGEPSNWIQTSYNTHEGIHVKGGTPLRKNYAGIGYKYDSVIDGFVPDKPKGCNSWKLNTDKGIYESPIPRPTDGKRYSWNESNKSWE